ncbi:MAG: tRNA uridine-5-carboxymethylaminomethyl(34) synthesis GTPase MnmE [Deltaproteobacteria bacterium]
MFPDASDRDTIAAVATPAGQAGIGIVRMSGPEARKIADRVFRPRNPVDSFQSHRLYLGHLIDPASGALVDEVLVSYMAAPHTYTREDVVEINSHSGLLLLEQILKILLREGARLAKPGEFTFRAFMNGRVDLTQAEAIIDLINAQSERGLHLASNQIHGRLRAGIEELRQKTVDLLAHLEVAIDFPEEDFSLLNREETACRIREDLLDPVSRILSGYGERKLWLEGLKTAIVGRVNVGKSSLLNRLLNEEKAMVTAIPGTTRDVIESTIHLQGLPLRLMDTAGFRKVRGELERMGIRRAEQKMEEADLVLLVIDRSRSLQSEDLDLLTRVKNRKAVVVLNKMDLPAKVNEETLESQAGGLPRVRISAFTGDGIEDLQKAIRDVILAGIDTADLGIAPNLRHKEALDRAAGHFERSASNLRDGLPLEIIAADLQGGLEALGEIVGETAGDEILDRIFSRFCVGK